MEAKWATTFIVKNWPLLFKNSSRQSLKTFSLLNAIISLVFIGNALDHSWHFSTHFTTVNSHRNFIKSCILDRSHFVCKIIALQSMLWNLRPYPCQGKRYVFQYSSRTHHYFKAIYSGHNYRWVNPDFHPNSFYCTGVISTRDENYHPLYTRLGHLTEMWSTSKSVSEATILAGRTLIDILRFIRISRESNISRIINHHHDLSHETSSREFSGRNHHINYHHTLCAFLILVIFSFHSFLLSRPPFTGGWQSYSAFFLVF